MSEDLEGRSETLPPNVQIYIYIDGLKKKYPDVIQAGEIEWRVYCTMNSTVGRFSGARIVAVLEHKRGGPEEIEIGDVQRGKYPFVDNSRIIGREVAEIWVRYY